MRASPLLVTCLILILAGCTKNEPSSSTKAPAQPAPSSSQATGKAAVPSTPAIPLTAAPFLTQPLTTTVVETTNEALPLWRSYAKNRPYLVMVANTPALQPVPAELTENVAQLLTSATAAELVRRSGLDEPAPLLLPEMSLSAALAVDWFSGVIWIFPSALPPEKLDPQIFKKQLIDAQIASEEEAQSFSLQNGSFRGTVHGRPFIAASTAALPDLAQSALLHVDANYFQPLYKGEIKTPLYPLANELLDKIKEKGWKIAAATVSLSNRDGTLPLQTRFLGKDLATILKSPQMLAQTFPQQWKRRSDVLYLENFMRNEEILKVYLAMERTDPADPAVKFGLYQLARQMKKPMPALDYLRKAVKLDPTYALEYLALSQLAWEKQQPEKAIEMLQLAQAALPHNPFIPMQLAHLLVATGRQEEAKALHPQLAANAWSKDYYPEQIEARNELQKQLQN